MSDESSDYSTADDVINAVRSGTIKGGVGLFGSRYYAYEPGLSSAAPNQQNQCETDGCLGDVSRGHFICRGHGTDHGRFIGLERELGIAREALNSDETPEECRNEWSEHVAYLEDGRVDLLAKLPVDDGPVDVA